VRKKKIGKGVEEERVEREKKRKRKRVRIYYLPFMRGCSSMSTPFSMPFKSLLEC